MQSAVRGYALRPQMSPHPGRTLLPLPRRAEAGRRQYDLLGYVKLAIHDSFEITLYSLLYESLIRHLGSTE